jgi:hypothetical protein
MPFAAAVLAVAIIVEAEQPKKIPRIGYLTGVGSARTFDKRVCGDTESE